MSVPTISAAELSQKIQAGEKLQILDVREPMERAESHIPDTAHIPLGFLPGRYSELQVADGEKLYIYCRSGARSASACSFLREKGIDAVNVSGGILAWGKLPNN